MPSVFLCHNSKDKPFVRKLAKRCASDGVQVWFDEAELNIGDSLIEKISGGIKNMEYVAVIISKNSIESCWVQKEISLAMSKEIAGRRVTVLPILVNKCSLPEALADKVYADFTLRENYEDEYSKLLRAMDVASISKARSQDQNRSKQEMSISDAIEQNQTAGNRSHSDRTVSPEFVRRSLFSTTTMPCVDPKMSLISVYSTDECPISKATVVAIADNATTKSANTDEEGVARLIIATRRQYQILIAHPDFPGAVINAWDSVEDIKIALASSENRGSVICMGTGYIPGLEGRLNPILDTSNRTYIYADNIAIDGGKNQPATFKVGDPFELEDNNGMIMQVRVLHIQGQTSLLQYAHPRYDC